MANALKARLPKKAEPQDIGDLIRDIQNEARMTAKELAKRADVSPSYLHKIQGGHANPSLAVVERLLDVLGFDLTLIYVPRGNDGND